MACRAAVTIMRSPRREVFGRAGARTRKPDSQKLRTFRNRIAHHEPIFQRNLVEDYERIVDVVTWLSPSVSSWMTEHSRVYEVIGCTHEDTYRF